MTNINTNTPRARRQANRITASLLVSISCLALEAIIGVSVASAQSAAQAPLPPVTVAAPEAKRRASTPSHSADRGGETRRTQAARRAPEPVAAPAPVSQSQAARTGTVGIYANSTAVATKVNTPLVNIPQSVNVIN